MIAVIQRCIALAWLGVLAAGLWLAAQGHAGMAAAVAGVAVFSHAVVLGLEFLLSRAASRAAGDPVAGIAATLRAWWAESLAAPRVFLWRQPFAHRRFPDHLPVPAAAARRGVVLVHGFVCNRGLWNPWLRRLGERGVPFVAVSLEPVFGSIDRYAGTIEAAVARLEAATGLAPVVVAHSMGGLAVRRWRVEGRNHRRLHRLITIATPHHGTALARLGFVTNARQMRRDSRWLNALREREQAEWAQQVTCFHSDCDNIVFPTRTATMSGADNRLLPGVAHVEMADAEAPFEEMVAWLER